MESFRLDLHISSNMKDSGKKPKMGIKALPARHVLTLLGFFGLFNVSAMCFNLSVTIVAMVKEPHVGDTPGVESGETCQELADDFGYNTSVHNISNSLKGEYDWNSNRQGLVLGSFFYGFIITQIPGGIIAERYGAKWLLGIGMLVASIFTLLTPLLARWSVWALVFARIMEGLGEGVAFPAINSLIGKWAPKTERSRMSTVISAGFQIGSVSTFAISGILSDSDILGGWPAVFYLFGTLGCVWFILWVSLVYESPETHPRISKEELLYIRQDQDERPTRKLPTPWKSILTSVPVWALVITHIGQGWGLYTFVIELPLYLSNILRFDLQKNGVLSALPSLMYLFCSVCVSIVADKLRASGHFKITTIRKILNSIGFFGPAICLLIVAFLGCRPVSTVSLLSLAMGIFGCIQSGFLITHVDMSPEFAGTLFGITNCFANITGFLVPAFVGWITQDGETVKGWGTIFTTASVILITTGIVYNFFSSAELQSWGKTSQSSEDTYQPRTVEMNDTTL